MSETPAAAPAADAPLQFDHAEASPPPTCVACSKPVTESYWEANGKLVCTPCRDLVVASRTGGSRVLRVLRAGGLGLLAALAGAVAYHVVRKVTDYELGPLYVGVGWLVGTAVARGAHRRGGLGYQLFAVAFTWVAVSWSAVPTIVEGMGEGENAVHGPLVWIISSVLSLAAPVYLGLGSPIMILIMGFAFWQAWKVNRRPALALVGPFALTPAAALADAEASAQPEPAVG
ncbi:hypothetical protein FGE12_08110 [Aggregicoccus sp. 17bor-14]|uniref:hypothetical protein n=1 Tax=Myxococcaceae TaxID=31 RepID=UPI00129C6867|nr:MULTISPECIES: hypothetical protein [Myxococcaceae]MBF5042361.1 hypothetical protein [Simulacricoccus sp. 17bor-14]MRI88134.1 hypothetical protein [Aggregicoccus sp. 17bor-14]